MAPRLALRDTEDANEIDSSLMVTAKVQILWTAAASRGKAPPREGPRRVTSVGSHWTGVVLWEATRLPRFPGIPGRTDLLRPMDIEV